MSMLVLLQIEAAPGKEEEVASLFAEFLPDTRRFDGCHSVSFHQAQDSATRFVVVERWTTKEHHEAYSRWRGERGDSDRMGALITAREVQYYNDLDA
jgi:quinol monooxygenase YgiN